MRQGPKYQGRPRARASEQAGAMLALLKPYVSSRPSEACRGTGTSNVRYLRAPPLAPCQRCLVHS